MNILDLTEDATNLLFKLFSLNELFKLRAVCQSWCVLIESRLSKQKTLRIFGSPSDVSSYHATLVSTYQNEPDLVFDTANSLILYRETTENDAPRCSIAFIANIFPMIDNLVIGYIPNDSEQPEYDLGTLLPYWAPALTTLTVAVNFVTDFHEQLHKAQWDAIKVMSNLRRLHLLGFSAYEVPLDILSLKQLTEFSLIRNPTFLKLDRILPQLGVNIKILRLFHEQIQQLDLEPSIGKWATGLDTLTLTISYPFELVSFISSFTGIRHFDFSPMSSFSFPFNDLLSHLSTYVQLNTLSFDFDAIRHYTLVGEDQDGQIHEHMLSTNEWYRRYHVRLPQLAPLRTISTLNLTDREYNFFQADVLGVEIGDVEEECIYKSNVDASHLLLLATAFPATKTVNLFSHFAGEEKFKEEVGGQVKHFWGEGVQVTFSKWATWGETRRHFGLTAKPENGS